MAHTCRGLVLKDMDMYEEARKAFDSALALNPHNGMAADVREDVLRALEAIETPP